MDLLGSHRYGLGILQGIANLLLTNGIGNSCGLPEEIKVLAHGSSSPAAAEGVVVEFILVVVKLVAETIVGVFEVDAR